MKRIYLSIIGVLLLLLGIVTYIYAQNFIDTKPTMQFSIPKSFGMLVTIYPAGGSTHMWFEESPQGPIRRVILSNNGTFEELNVWTIDRP
ncbi:MAG: hypothetical protein U9P14_06510 [Gemmatimonadota bacterium]|nr:hypothetical protein [Gemmatimonadota bacterium]